MLSKAQRKSQKMDWKEYKMREEGCNEMLYEQGMAIEIMNSLQLWFPHKTDIRSSQQDKPMFQSALTGYHHYPQKRIVH